MTLQDMVKTAVVVGLAMVAIYVVLFIAGSILITLAVAVPLIIGAVVVFGLVFGKKDVSFRRDNGRR